MTKHFKKYTVSPVAGGFEVVFTNKDTGAEIHMTIPADGLFEGDPTRQITQQEVKDLAGEVVDKLDEFLH